MSRAITIERELHPLAAVFPPMTEAEFEDLKKDVLANGQIEPITLLEGKILDGRNRNRVCIELGIEPHFRDWDGRGSPLSYVLGKNLLRRHLTDSQRAILAARLVPEFEAEAKANMIKGGQGRADLPTVHARDRAAEVTRVSSRLVGSAATVLGRGVPELIAAVERGAVKVSAAEKVAALDLAEQTRLVGEGARAIRTQAAELRRARKPRNPGPTSEPEASGPVRPAAAADDALTDQQWLEGFPLRGRLANPRLFDAQALVYRHALPVIERIRKEYPDVEAALGARLSSMDPAPLRLGRVAPMPDPAGWAACSWCDGQGADPEGGRCGSCDGDGFRAVDREGADPDGR